MKKIKIIISIVALLLIVIFVPIGLYFGDTCKMSRNSMYCQQKIGSLFQKYLDSKFLKQLEVDVFELGKLDVLPESIGDFKK